MILLSLIELLKTSALIFLLNDYFIRNHPNRHNEICIDIAFNIIYVYSYCQMLFNNNIIYLQNKAPVLFNFFTKLFKNNNKNFNIEIIKDSSIVAFSSKDVFLNEINFKIPECDFIVYTDGETYPSNIKIIRDCESKMILNEKIYEYEKSDIKFILVECIIFDKTYVIELSSDKYNFYIKDNILDFNFFLYYLHYFHKDEIFFEEQINNMTLKIMDHNVDIQTIYFTKGSNQVIKLNETSYEIL